MQITRKRSQRSPTWASAPFGPVSIKFNSLHLKALTQSRVRMCTVPSLYVITHCIVQSPISAGSGIMLCSGPQGRENIGRKSQSKASIMAWVASFNLRFAVSTSLADGGRPVKLPGIGLFSVLASRSSL